MVTYYIQTHRNRVIFIYEALENNKLSKPKNLTAGI